MSRNVQDRASARRSDPSTNANATSQSDGTGNTAACSAPPSGSAWRHLPSHLRLWLVAGVGLCIDLGSKHWAFSELPPGGGRIIIPHLMRFQRSLNTGALFGLGKGWTPLFIAASILALLFVLYLFIHSTREGWSLHIALGLVLAGALGNLYDRAFAIADVVYVNGKSQPIVGLVTEQTEDWWSIGSFPEGENVTRIPATLIAGVRQQGVVRDFIKMEPRIRIAGRSFDIYPWVFNVADVLLVVGVAILMLNFWRERRAARASRQPAAGPAVEDAPRQ